MCRKAQYHHYVLDASMDSEFVTVIVERVYEEHEHKESKSVLYMDIKHENAAGAVDCVNEAAEWVHLWNASLIPSMTHNGPEEHIAEFVMAGSFTETFEIVMRMMTFVMRDDMSIFNRFKKSAE